MIYVLDFYPSTFKASVESGKKLLLRWSLWKELKIRLQLPIQSCSWIHFGLSYLKSEAKRECDYSNIIGKSWCKKCWVNFSWWLNERNIGESKNKKTFRAISQLFDWEGWFCCVFELRGRSRKAILKSETENVIKNSAFNSMSIELTPWILILNTPCLCYENRRELKALKI